MISFKEFYKRIVEDAVVSGGETAGGEIVSGEQQSDGEIQPDEVNSTGEEVLGKCDHKKDGYFGSECFHLPKMIGKVMKRYGVDAKSNPYLSLGKKKKKKD